MGILINVISLYKSQDLNKEKLLLQSAKLIDDSIYSIPSDKPLMIHIWATWCPICKVEADNIQRLSRQYEVLTIAVNSGNDYEISSYLKENDLNFRVINDIDGLFAKKLNVAVYPTTFIYDKNRNLVFSEVGYTSSFGLFARMVYSSFK